MAIKSMHFIRRLFIYCVSFLAFLIVIFISMNRFGVVFENYHDYYATDSEEAKTPSLYKYITRDEKVTIFFYPTSPMTPNINKDLQITLLEKTSNGSNLLKKQVTTNGNELNTMNAAKTVKSVDITKTTIIAYPLTAFGSPYVLNNEKICEGTSNLTFIVVVHSATDHFYRRSVIRETWANRDLLKNQSMRVVFLLGRPQNNKKIQAAIEHESSIHKDIVQGDFLDTYHNLTHKGVLGYRWISEFCLQAKFLIKVDDDVFVNIFKLFLDTSRHYNTDKRKLRCYIRVNGTSPIQRKTGKWMVEDSEFNNMTYFPVTYCNGFFVFMTTDVIKEFYEASKVTPFFWIDDIYIFGLLPAMVGSVRFESIAGLSLNEEESLRCFTMNKPCDLLSGTAVAKGNMETLWYGSLMQYKSLATTYVQPQLFRV